MTLNPIPYVRRKIIAAAVRMLTKPLKQYTLQIPNDLENLKRYIRKGDVLLVEGNERISEVIKYLTQSSWSHSALYVGDEPLRRDPELKRALTELYGGDAHYLLVEALVDRGVMLSPLVKYRDLNIRVCRPFNLTAADLREVLNQALSEVGYTYDLKNIADLARYFFPVSLVPRRLRRKALRFGSGEPTRVICSSMIANCFKRVKFPIVPKFVSDSLTGQSGLSARGIMRFMSRPRWYESGVFKSNPSEFITPRDFDLSPYFEVIKFNMIESQKFDYRKLRWAIDEDETAVAAAGDNPPALPKRGG